MHEAAEHSPDRRWTGDVRIGYPKVSRHRCLLTREIAQRTRDPAAATVLLNPAQVMSRISSAASTRPILLAKVTLPPPANRRPTGRRVLSQVQTNDPESPPALKLP